MVFFAQFVVDNRKAQKFLLIGFEKLVETYREQLLPKAALILKSFYDNDILEEEAILEWADKVRCLVCIIANLLPNAVTKGFKETRQRRSGKEHS